MAGRFSDTRERVRAVADRFVAEGSSPHEVTVDRLYAELKQGSRTTINDELRIWRRERARMDAQRAALPHPVLNAAHALWDAASQAAEAALLERRQEIENQREALQERLRALEGDLARARDSHAVLHAQITSQDDTITALRQELVEARTAADTAHAQVEMLSGQLEAQHADAERRLSRQQTDYESRIAALTEAATRRDATYRAEIEKAHARLEGVQNHMLQQVAEAREVAKRAEAALAKARERGDELAAELQAAREDLAATKAAGREREAGSQQEIARLLETTKSLQGQADEARQGEAIAKERLAAAAEKIAAQAEQLKAAEREKASLLDLLAKRSKMEKTGGLASR
jgi:chromosome segregation ATPase